jgi:hypothetical protein
MAIAPLSPSGKLKRSRTDTGEHAINGLLTKRADLFNEAEQIRDRLAEIKNDVEALDRTLKILGFEGDLDAIMPRQRRHVVFGKGELTNAIVDTLRDAERPLGSREIAASIISIRGDDPRDRRFLTDVTRRASKALRILRESGDVKGVKDKRGNMLWERAAG